MSILTDDMKRIIREQKLGFVATVCPDGTPNLARPTYDDADLADTLTARITP
jgi:hypothetical protein